jgi:DNA-binding GntR family transcriptional regulator
MVDLDTLATVERDTLQEQIYRQLRARLMSGGFRPGQAMSMRSIAAAVGASVMPVRDALRRLETEKALVPGPNRTLMVPQLAVSDLEEIRDIRMVLEGMAVERAAVALDADGLAALDAAFADMEAAVAETDVEAYLRANWAFHNAIYRARGETLLTSIIESLWARMGPYIRVAASGDIRHFETAMRAHRAILDALKSGDPKAARAALERDIVGAARDLAARLTETPTRPRERSDATLTFAGAP